MNNNTKIVDVFTKKEIFRLYGMVTLSKVKCLLLLKKILQLDNDMIYTKAMMTDLILNNNPSVKRSKSTIIKEVYKMQDIAKEKVICVINKFDKEKVDKINKNFRDVMQLYIRKMELRGIEIEDDCLFLWSVEKQGSKTFMQIHESYLDSIIQLCNTNSYDSCVAKLLKYDEPLYDVMVELIGEEQVKKHASKELI